MRTANLRNAQRDGIEHRCCAPRRAFSGSVRRGDEGRNDRTRRGGQSVIDHDDQRKPVGPKIEARTPRRPAVMSCSVSASPHGTTSPLAVAQTAGTPIFTRPQHRRVPTRRRAARRSSTGQLRQSVPLTITGWLGRGVSGTAPLIISHPVSAMSGLIDLARCCSLAEDGGLRDGWFCGRKQGVVASDLVPGHVDISMEQMTQ